LPHSPVKDVVVSQDETIFSSGEDYSVDTVSGTITRLPLGGIAIDALIDITYIQDTPRESINSTSLMNQVGLVMKMVN